MAKVKINIEVKDNSKRLFGRQANIMECLLELPTVDPTKLSIFDEKNNKIFKVEVKPAVNRVNIHDNGLITPDTGVSGLNQVGVTSVRVKQLAGVEIGGDQYARINGTIDLPISGRMKRVSMENAYFTDEETANAVALAAAEIEMEKALKMKEEVDGAVKVLSQICEVYSGSKSRVVVAEATTNEQIADILENAAEQVRNEEDFNE